MSIHLDVYTQAHQRSINDTANDIQRQFNRTGQNSADEFAKGFESRQKRIEAAARKAADASGKVIVEDRKVAETRAQVERQTKALEQSEKKLTDTKKDGASSARDIASAEREVERVRSQLDRATTQLIARSESLRKAHRNEASSARDMANAYREMTDSVDNVSNSARGATSSLTGMGAALGALGRVGTPVAVVGLGAALVEVAGVAASATKSLWLMPAALGAAGTAFGTLKLATLGFGDALSSIRDPEAFAEALRGLSPNARDAARSIQALMPELMGLKNATQDALFAGMGQQLNAFISQYLPTIENLTTSVASSFNNMFTGVTDQLMTPQTMASIQTFTTNVAQAFENLAPAAGSLTQALADIMSVGSEFLPDLASGAASAAQAFADFIREAKQSGELKQWLSEGLETVKQLGSGVATAAEAFMRLAPIGEKLLPEMLDFLEGINDIMPVIGAAAVLLGPPFGAWQVAVDNVKNSFDLVGSAVEALKGIVTSTANAVIPVVNTIGQAISNSLQPIRNMIDLANKLPGVNIPQLNEWSPINQLGGAPSSGPDPFGSAQRRGVATDRNRSSGAGTPNLMPGTPGSPGSGAAGPGWGIPDTRPGWNPQTTYQGGAWTGPSGGAGDAPPFFDPGLWSIDSMPAGLASESGLTPNAVQLNRIVTQMFPQLDSIGGWRPPDGFNEHSSGEALDIMVQGALGDQVNQWLLQNADALGLQYTLWQQQNWKPDGSVSGMEDRGSATQNHMDHIHARVRPGPASGGGPMSMPGAMAPAPGVTGGPGFWETDQQGIFDAETRVMQERTQLEESRLRLLELEAKGNASQRELLSARADVTQGERQLQSAEMSLAEAQRGTWKEMDSTARSFANGMGQVGAQLDADFGLSGGLPGLFDNLTRALANLAFAPMIGALSAVQAMAPGPQGGSGLIGIAAAQSPTYGIPAPAMPTLTAAVAPSVMGPAPLGGGAGAPLIPGAPVGPFGPPPGPGVPAFPGASAPAPSSIIPGGQSGGPPGVGGGMQQGAIGGIPLAALSTAASGLDILAPGAGQAAQVGIQLANRAAGYAGQVAGIAAGGLLETFSLSGSGGMTDPLKTLPGRLLAGFAGARPALPNTAGQPQQPGVDPNTQQHGTGQGQAPGPLVSIENVNQAPGQTPDSVATSVASQFRSYEYSSGFRGR